MTIREMQEEILRLKKEKDICVLAHSYVAHEIIEVADFTGDSFQLSVLAEKAKQKTVLMCGVRFMAETVKILSPDKKVVLGLITTKRPELEDKDAVIARIHEAEKYIPIDRLCLSPQCGFASCEIGNKITEEQQWAKLALVKEIAQKVWKKTATSE